MSFRDCLIRAVEQNVLTEEEAAALGNDFDARFAEARLGLGDDAAAQAAKDALEAELRAQAIEKQRQANLMERARTRLKSDIQEFRGLDGEPDVYKGAMGVLSHYGYRGYSSIRGRGEAIVTMVQGQLSETMIHFRRSGISGQRINQTDMPDFVSALHGKNVGNPTAKALADGVQTVFEDLRQRFNAAGGAIAKRDDFGLPHSHDGLKIRKVGRDAWKRSIGDLVDWDKTINPLTGQTMGDAGRDRFLNRMFEQVTTSGWAHHTPTMRPTGKGALSRQRQEHRVVTFKSANDWMSYNESFGSGGVIDAVFTHINSMAKDISAMEILGPNPDGMLEWLVQNVRREIAAADGELPSLAKERSKLGKGATGVQPGAYAEWRLRSLYGHLRGRGVVASGVSDTVADARNVANSALLGFAGVLAATTDPFLDRAARYMAGMPLNRDAFAMLKNLRGAKREEIIQAGAIWDEYLYAMDGEARFMGLLTGRGWSQYLVDRSMMAFGLKPLTTGRRLVHARQWHQQMGAVSNQSFENLNKKFRRVLEGFGIDRNDWNVMRQARDPSGMVTPASVAEFEKLNPVSDTADKLISTGTPLAEKYAEMIASWTERAVPSGTPNARSFVTGSTERGTLLGEVVESGLQFKSFGLSFTTLQIEQMMMMSAADGKWNAARYMTALSIALSVGAAVKIQLQNLADGKDLEDMGADNAQFWVRSLLQGGGFGLLGDFAGSSETRFGQGVAGVLVGPSLAMASDAVGLTVGNAMKGLRGEDANVGRDAVNYAGRYTPILSSQFATRLGYRRLFLDQLQKQVDPRAARSFKSKQRNLQKRTGQKYWWPPGRNEPQRGPRVSPAPS